MSISRLWLTVLSDENNSKWPIDIRLLTVEINNSTTLKQCNYKQPFRTSPIFPIEENYILCSLDKCNLYFFSYSSSYRILGRLKELGSTDLKKRIFFNIGISSIILITENKDFYVEFLYLINQKPNVIESWYIENNCIIDVNYDFYNKFSFDITNLNLINYEALPTAERAIIDEFYSNIILILPKLSIHIPDELHVYKDLVERINELVIEIVYLMDTSNQNIPETLNEYEPEQLSNDPFLREIIVHQNIDRIIQVNSALTYVSTQALSGASPILERRSLIRRYSLLGVGSANIALNKITRSIENAFALHPVEEIVSKFMAHVGPLPGIDSFLDYNSDNWSNFSVNRWSKNISPRSPFSKLPYFSGRLGYRETEYTIAAAVQSITTGAGFEWSLLTLTHELLHGHVRNIIALVFQGNISRQSNQKREEYYYCYETHVLERNSKDENLIECIRNIIFAYCSLTVTHGSLTRITPTPENIEIIKKSSKVKKVVRNFLLLSMDDLWCQVEIEYRNLSEIFVHILDLHYFYGSRLSAYIPLIWRSWAAVPHVKGDIRQYILRSIVTIAVKTSGTPYVRFNECVKRFKELIDTHIKGFLNVPIIHEIIKYIENEEMRENLFYAFSASLIIVDLFNNIFVSKDIRGTLMSDPLVFWKTDNSGFEEKFEYKLPDGFNDEIIEKPAAFLLDRILRKFNNSHKTNDLEKETASLFLACSSNLREDRKNEQ